MGLLTFSINVTLDGCVDHQEGIADQLRGAMSTSRIEFVPLEPDGERLVANLERRTPWDS